MDFKTYLEQEKKPYDIFSLTENSSNEEIYQTYFGTIYSQPLDSDDTALDKTNREMNITIIEKLFAKGYSLRKICEIMKCATYYFTESEISKVIEQAKETSAIQAQFNLLMQEIGKSKYYTKYEEYLKDIHEKEINNLKDKQEMLYFLYFELDRKIAKKLIMCGMAKADAIDILTRESLTLQNKFFSRQMAEILITPIVISPIILNYSNLYSDCDLSQEKIYSEIKRIYSHSISHKKELSVLDYQTFILLYEQIKYKILRANPEENIERSLSDFPDIEDIKNKLFQSLAYEDQLICDHIQKVRFTAPINTQSLSETSTSTDIYAAYAQKVQKYHHGVPDAWDNKIINDEIQLYLYKDGYNANKIAEIFEESTLMVLPTAEEIENNIPALLREKIIRDDIALQTKQPSSLYQKIRLKKLNTPGENIDSAIALEYYARENTYPSYSLEIPKKIQLEKLFIESPHLFMLALSEKEEKINQLIVTVKQSEPYKNVLAIRKGVSIAEPMNIFSVYAGILAGFGEDLKASYKEDELIQIAAYMLLDQHELSTIKNSLACADLEKQQIDEYLKKALNYVRKLKLAKLFNQEDTFNCLNKDVFVLAVNKFFKYDKKASIMEVIQTNNDLNDQIAKWLDEQNYEVQKIREIMKESPLQLEKESELTADELLNAFQNYTSSIKQEIKNKEQHFHQLASNEFPTINDFSSLKEYRSFMKEKEQYIFDSMAKAKAQDREYLRLMREQKICDELIVQLSKLNSTQKIKGKFEIANMTTFFLLYADTFKELLTPSMPASTLQVSVKIKQPVQQENKENAISQQDGKKDVSPVVTEAIDANKTIAEKPAPEAEIVKEISKTEKPKEVKIIGVKETKNPLLLAVLQYKNDAPIDTLKPSDKFMKIANDLAKKHNGIWSRDLDILAVKKLITFRINVILLQKIISELTPSVYGLSKPEALDYMSSVIEESKKDKKETTPALNTTKKIFSKPALAVESSVAKDTEDRKTTNNNSKQLNPSSSIDTENDKLKTAEQTIIEPEKDKNKENDNGNGNFNLEQIINFQNDDEDILMIDEKYLFYANDFYKKNKEWKDDFDKAIAEKLLVDGFTEESIITVLLLNSPYAPHTPLEHRAERVKTLFDDISIPKDFVADIADIEPLELEMEQKNSLDTKKKTKDITPPGIAKILEYALPEGEFDGLTDPQKYMYLAKQLLKKHNKWQKEFDFEIAQTLHKDGVSLPFIDRTIHNYSPLINGKSLTEKEEYVKEVINAI